MFVVIKFYCVRSGRNYLLFAVLWSDTLIIYFLFSVLLLAISHKQAAFSDAVVDFSFAIRYKPLAVGEADITRLARFERATCGFEVRRSIR